MTAMGQRVGPGVAALPVAGVMLGAGAPLVLAASIGQAGRWALIGLALAVATVALTFLSLSDLAANSAPGRSLLAQVRERVGPVPARMTAVLALGGRVIAIAAVAGVAGYAVFPAQPAAAAVAFIVFATAWAASGVGAHPAMSAVPIVTVVFVAVVTSAIAPETQVTDVMPGTTGADEPTGVLAAAGVLAVGFLGVERAVGLRRRTGVLLLAGVAAAYAVVGFLALRQLGGARLALSPNPLRDAVVAADGGPIAPLIAAGIAAGALLALRALVDSGSALARDMAAIGDLPDAVERHGVVVVGAAGALAALLTDPGWAVEVAAVLVLGSLAFANSAARALPRACRSTWVRTGCCGLALCVGLAVNISVASLAVAVAVLAVGTGLSTVWTRSRK